MRPLLRIPTSRSSHGTKARNRRCPFGVTTRRDVGREVLAGILGWLTIVSSVAFYSSLLVGDEVDKEATLEVYMLVAGLSTIGFGLITNMPFVVAPSVLYAVRETGVTIGGHLAAQAIVNAAATLAFMFAVELNIVSYIPTALRVGVGCGISMLVSVLGLRSMGLLLSNTFDLQPLTWESVVGLGVITAGSMTLPPAFTAKKWMYIVGIPTTLTVLVYAIVDRTKFQGYSTAENPPLSNWADSTIGLVDFAEILKFPGLYLFYMLRTFLSVIINISSILLVLIDSVCLEKMRGKVKSSGEQDFSNAIGGTNKFRFMVCAIPFMSCIGNLVGVTTQAAFVQSMIIVFAGGRTGLSAVVTGGLFILSTVFWPLLPLLVPGHISGALAVVINLRFFTVLRMIDVTRASNLLMFGLSILLIPLSFNFVDALCIATVLGFLCEFSSKIVLQGGVRKKSKIAVSSTEDEVGLSCTHEDETEKRSTSNTSQRRQPITGDTNISGANGSAPDEEAVRIPLQATATKGCPPSALKQGALPNVNLASVPTPPVGGGEGAGPKAGTGGRSSLNIHGRAVLARLPHSQGAMLPRTTYQEQTTLESVPDTLSSNRYMATLKSASFSGRRVSMDIPSGTTVQQAFINGRRESREGALGTSYTGRTYSQGGASAGPSSVHWSLALVAMIELVLKVVNDEIH